MVLLWGSTWAAIKIGVGLVPPYMFAFERAIAVASLLTIAVLVLRQSFPRTRAALAASAVSGFFNIGTSWALIFWAEQFVPSGLVAVFGAMAPVWTAILAHFFVHGDRLSRLKVVALVLGLVGTALLVGAPAPSEGPDALLATALLAIMPISWAIAAILIARFLSRESPIAVVGIGTWVSAAFLLPFALTQAGQPQEWNATSIIAFAYLVIGGSCIGLVLNAWLYRKLRPTTVTLSQVLIPTQALLIGALVLGEEFTLRMLAGAALVASAVALNARSGGTAGTSEAAPVATAAD
jgi:drug/metabolite transporter (DMT)-like permease